MEFIWIGILLAIGWYLAPFIIMMIVGTVGLVFSILSSFLGKKK